MSGWEDIDGSMVMNGSPGIVLCMTHQMESAIRDDSFGAMPIEKVKEIAEKHGHPELAEQCQLSIEVIQHLIRMFTWYDRDGPISTQRVREALEVMKRPL